MKVMLSPCTFCLIAAHELAAALVFEDETSLAFLDHRPLFAGHCLLIPKAHFATLRDLPEALTGRLFANAQMLSAAVEDGLGAAGSFVAVNNRVSQSVPHLHIHVVPRRQGDGLKGFFWPRRKYRDSAEMEATRLTLLDAVARIQTKSQP
ncbi:MAG TPA: HIT family protein [Candidatus Acidoferrales bacterium]|jgi:histidine triad (HIT) family protein|nr:HIT family protein [Candidatus Acidoferrales bacterium]